MHNLGFLVADKDDAEMSMDASSTDVAVADRSGSHVIYVVTRSC